VNCVSLQSILAMLRRHPRVCEVLLVPCLLFMIFWVFVGTFLDGRHSVATWVDNTHLFLPLFSHISKSFTAGEFPYWINSIVGGIPLYNTPLFTLLYPFYFFNWGLYQSPLDALMHVHYVTLLHLGICLLNTYVMLRIFHLGVVSSVIGATLFAFGANAYQYAVWVTILAPYSWLPLALGSVYLILENHHLKVGLFLGWISTYLLVSASPAQPLIHLVYCTAFLCVAYWTVHFRDKAKLAASLRNLILLAVGSVLLSAAALIPALVFSQRDMIRWVGASTAVIGNEPVPFDSFLHGQTKTSELAKLMFPLYIQHFLGDSYLGLLPIFLALFGLFRSKRNWIVAPLFILALYTALSSAGSNTGLAYVNYLLPFWNKIREPGRHLVVCALATCALAGFGFEHLIDWIKGSCKSYWRRHAWLFGLFLLVLLSCYWVRQQYTTLIDDTILLGSFLLFLLLLAACRFLPRWSGFIASGLLPAVILYPQLQYPFYVPEVHKGDYFEEPNLRSHRVLSEIAKLPGIRDYRLVIQDNHLEPPYWSMNAVYYGLRTFQAFLNPMPYQQFREMFPAPSLPNYARLLGAKYYLDCTDQPCALPDCTLEKEIEGCKLYATSQARPHYFVATEVGPPYKNLDEFLTLIQQNNDYMSKVSVESQDAQQVAAWLDAATGPCVLETLEETSSQNSLRLLLKTNRKSLLVLNEYFRPAWRATLNDQSQKLLRVNLNQTAMLLPEGTNRVRFEYWPRRFVWLLYLGKGLIVLMALSLVLVISKRRDKASDSVRPLSVP
jgi:hypothetical protein